jgi:TetR/AcrR family transcriptional regulator
MPRRPSRKRLILETLARELERQPGSRITTAGLALAAGVSEAALYRHFASKCQMFESLLGFAEETVFARVNKILEDDRQARVRCGKLLFLLLGFAERNPGIARVLLGDVLVGENERLRARVDQFYARFETQLRQVLREAPLREGTTTPLGADGAAALLLALVEGRMHRFLRTGFTQSPLEEIGRAHV